MVKVHEKLQELLTWRGVTQYDLADRLDIARGSINSYVVGRNQISFELAYRMAEALGVTPWTLLNGEPLPATELDLSREEAQWVTDLRGLTLEQRELIQTMTDTMKRQNQRT